MGVGAGGVCCVCVACVLSVCACVCMSVCVCDVHVCVCVCTVLRYFSLVLWPTNTSYIVFSTELNEGREIVTSRAQ